MQALELQAEVTKNREICLKLPHDIEYGTVRVIVLYEPKKSQNRTATRRQFGQFKGQIEISEDFDDTLPDTFWSGENA
ncbi:MAG: hypothetical protein WGN25_02635 [Candidatus Electrothrix sp. GW3-4]|uniref:hypothetical protein n=1 Tax=Candidatus Electrothrix sp. GW3-4 TaxID=3126740 RepID=UPI0030CB55E9